LELSYQPQENKMNAHGLLVTMFALALSFAPQFVNTSSAASGKYSAQLISPTAGQVLPWAAIQGGVDCLTSREYGGCEMEIWLSLDGGRTFTMCISPHLGPQSKYFYWTVPNTPTNAAVLDIRFGCELYYPESYTPQTASPFVIAKALPASS
jgi:hypothetical protein